MTPPARSCFVSFSPIIRPSCCAAAVVLGELGLRDAEVSQAVCEGLADTDAAVRLRLLTVAGQLRIEPALPQLIKKIEEGGEESELAAQAAAKLGLAPPRRCKT